MQKEKEKETCRLNLTVKKSSLELFRAQAAVLNLRPGAFFDVLMSLLSTQSEDPEKLLGRFVMEVINNQSVK